METEFTIAKGRSLHYLLLWSSFILKPPMTKHFYKATLMFWIRNLSIGLPIGKKHAFKKYY